MGNGVAEGLRVLNLRQHQESTTIQALFACRILATGLQIDLKLPPHIFSNVMLPVIQPIDALWHCLCPSFARWSSATTLSVPSFSRSGFGQWLGGSPSSAHRTSSRLQRPLNPLTYKFQPQLRRADAPYSLLHTSQDTHSTTDSIGPVKKYRKSKSSRYEELRRASNKGEYVQVQEIVRGLIQDGGETPNTRLYTALLLANTSAEYGSPLEVQRLLQEMKDEGVPTDSVIYHAALKVVQTVQYSVFTSSMLTRGKGSLCTPRLCSPKRNSRGIRAKVVHFDRRGMA